MFKAMCAPEPSHLPRRQLRSCLSHTGAPARMESKTGMGGWLGCCAGRFKPPDSTRLCRMRRAAAAMQTSGCSFPPIANII